LLLIRLLPGQWPYNSLGFQYSSAVVPFILWAGLEGYERSWKNRLPVRTYAMAVILCAILLQLSFCVIFDPWKTFRLLTDKELAQHNALLSDTLRTVPADAAIICNTNIAPHVTSRAAVGLPVRDELMVGGKYPAQFILLDMKNGNPFPYQPQELIDYARKVEKSRQWMLLSQNDGIELFKRK
jgi:hypothetical protein